MSNKKVPVTEETIREWAEGTIAEWFPGYTDVDDVHNVQFKIVHVAEDTFQVEETYPHNHYWEPRVFEVTVSVKEK